MTDPEVATQDPSGTSIAERAADLPEPDGGFAAQQQAPPGETGLMRPRPDHGEETYVGSAKLKGLRALITGGDSGIGRAVAIAFAREGADVAIAHLESEQTDADEVLEEIRAAGRVGVSLTGDLVDRTACESVVEGAVAALGGLDILVNNAGYHWARGPEGIDGLEPEQVERVLATNLAAVIWVTKAASPHLSKGSCIINTSSVQAYDPSTALLDYAATKAAVNNLTVNLAADLGPRGIRVNAVAPGPIWTPLQPATREPDTLTTFGVSTPLGRAGQPGEVAPAYVFLASPADASYVSGTVIGVTGGKPVF